MAELDEEYIRRMEDILAVYEKPLSEREPVVCVDEKPVVLHQEIRPPQAMRPGRAARRDGEYQRCGTANVFCGVQPKAGRYFPKVTAHRSSPEFADYLLDVAARYPFIAPAAQYCVAPLYELDLSSLRVTAITSIGACCIESLAASGDGSKLLVAMGGTFQAVAIYDAASNTWAKNNTVMENFGGNAAVSIDGSVFATGSGMVDASTDLLGYLAWQDVFQSPGPSPSLALEKVPDGGSLVYIPYANYTEFNLHYPSCVDIFDVNHGALLHRINLAEQIQQVTDAMAIDSYGQTIYLITSAGLTVVHLGAAPLSIGHLTPSSGPAGTNVTIHGSGFQNATIVAVKGSPATTTFVDPNTLQMIVPGGASGSDQITVTNPSSQSYSLDNAFRVQ